MEEYARDVVRLEAEVERLRGEKILLLERDFDSPAHVQILLNTKDTTIVTLREAIEAYREEEMGSRSDCFCVQTQVPGKDHWPTCQRLLDALTATEAPQ